MGKIMKDGISYSGSTYTGGTDIEITGANVINAKVRELTQAQYDALSSAEKNNGTTYYITDGIPSVIGVTDVEDGGQSIVTNHVADVSHKVNKSGDTMTGNLTIENQTNGSVQIINPNTDLEDADNGISNIETNAYSIIDGGSNMQMSGLTNMVYPNGLVQTTLQVSNFDTNGDPVSNSITLTVDKDGNKSYSVSDGAAFRRAIGSGTITDVQVDGASVVTSGVAEIDLTGKADAADLGTAASMDVPLSGDASTTEVVKGDDTRLTDARNAADVYSWAKASTKPSYTASEVGAVSTDDGIVYGGTLSSSETIDLNDTRFRLSNARTIYWLQIGSKTSNAPISSGYGNLECHQNMQRFTTYSSGRTYIRWYVNSSWTTWQEINTTYTFAEGSTNGAFSVTPSGGSEQSVTIHGLGEYTTKDGSATNVATGVYTTLTSLAITAGTYLVEYQASFAANAKGMRRIFITQSSTSSSANPQFSYINVQNTGSSYGTALNGMVIVKTSASATLYLRAYHDAGTTLSVTGRIGTIRIK